MKVARHFLLSAAVFLLSSSAEAATLTITTAGPNTGAVGVRPTGQVCNPPSPGGTCTFTIPDGTALKLSANSPTTPGIFSAPGGDAAGAPGCTPGTSTCSFVLNTSASITATFTAGSYPSITIALDGVGETTNDNNRCQNYELGFSGCKSFYAAGSEVELRGQNVVSSLFASFSGGTADAAGCASTPCIFTLDTDSTVTAHFAALTSFAVDPAAATVNAGDMVSFNAVGTFDNGGTRALVDGAPGAFGRRAMSSPRYSLAAGLIDNRIYAIGGAHLGAPSSRIERYDPANPPFGSDSWSSTIAGSMTTPLAPMPTPREGLAAAVLGGKLYALGGHTTGGVATAAVEAYDAASNSWSTKPPISTPRAGLAAAVIGDRLYAVGGGEHSAPVNTFEAYDLSTNSWTPLPPLPTARFGLAAAVANGKLYGIGGFDGTNLVATVEMYDPVSSTWTTVASMPTARELLVAGEIDGLIYVAGGNGAGAATVLAYNPTTDSWSTVGSMSPSRAEAAAVVLDGRLFAAGGLASNPPNPPTAVSTLQAFRPPEATWWSDNSAVATIAAFGDATALGEGTATIVARTVGVDCTSCAMLTVMPPPPPFAGGGQRSDVNDFLQYQGLSDSITRFAGPAELTFNILYGPTINPATFRATFDGEDVTMFLNPVPGTSEQVEIPLASGRHVLLLTVDGVNSQGRTATDRDRLTFVVR